LGHEDPQPLDTAYIANPSHSQPATTIQPQPITTITSTHHRIQPPQGHIQILYGNLAPEGSVAKITGKEGLHFEGKVGVGVGVGVGVRN